LKVAFHVDQLWFSAPGGIGTYVSQLLRQLPAADPTLDLVPFHARWRRPPPEAPATIDGRFGVELQSSIRTLYPAWSYLGRPALPRSLAGADVVHATNPAAVPPVRAGQRLVVTVHDLTVERFPELFPPRWRRLYRRGVRAAVARADALITPSRDAADDLVELLGADRSRIHVTPLAPGLRALEEPVDRADAEEELADYGVQPPFILAVGTIEPRKNLVRLVRAYRRLAAEGLPHSLVLVGPEGWGAEEVRRELAAGGPGTVRMTGSLSAAYSSAAVVAYVSLYEGFGLPVLEALSMGAPVVASRTSSIPEVAGDAALLVDPTDESAIADALRRVLTDDALAADLRMRGPARSAGFSWERTARETLDVYRSVIG